MVDVTLVAAAAITGGVGLAAAGMQALTSWRQMDAERERRTADAVERRRRERQKAYQSALDLLTDFGWDAEYAGAGYDVVVAFTKPFIHAANRVRIYGSPAAIVAVDELQRGFALLNRTEGDPATASAWELINNGMDQFANAARDDVGPRPEDRLKHANYQPGAGPRT